MKVFSLSTLESEPSDPKTFVGQARLTRMNDAADRPHTNVYRVAFEPGARTHWHTHTGPQLLQVIEGTCRYQKDGGAVREADVGDLIAIEPGERHWHGAGPTAAPAAPWPITTGGSCSATWAMFSGSASP